MDYYFPPKKRKLQGEHDRNLLKECQDSNKNVPFSVDVQDQNLVLENIVHVPPFCKTVESENLHLKYFKLFLPNAADAIFQRLENEVEYFTGALQKVRVFGKLHDIPRKQASYGDSGLTYKFSGNSIPALPWTPLLLQLKEKIEKVVEEEFNFVLVNRYKDGSDYMGEHRDDEKDLVADAPIASLSFGQSRDFVLKHKDSRGAKATRKIEPIKLVLEHGSLLIMQHPTNNFWYHSLPARKNVRNVRINLTFRKMVKKKA